MEISFATGAQRSGRGSACLLFYGLMACTRNELKPVTGAPSPAPLSAASESARPTPAPAATTRVVTFEGTCDASDSVALDDHRFVVVDDEDNLLRIYDADRGGPALDVIDLTSGLGLDGKKPEADLEACTRIGDTAYFLGSHARTSKGKRDASRLLFFAMSLPSEGRRADLLGKPCHSLLDELFKHPALVPFGLEKAAELGPKEPGGLNIEGLTGLSDGSLVIGFRNPIPEGRALLVRLLNPSEVAQGKQPRLSAAIRLDLGGLGVRELSTWRSRLLLIAGPSGNGGPFYLYSLSEDFTEEVRSSFDFTGYGPEGLFTPDARDSVLVLSDDGTMPIDGVPCKRVKEPAKKHFRGVWVEPPPRAKPG